MSIFHIAILCFLKLSPTEKCGKAEGLIQRSLCWALGPKRQYVSAVSEDDHDDLSTKWDNVINGRKVHITL